MRPTHYSLLHYFKTAANGSTGEGHKCGLLKDNFTKNWNFCHYLLVHMTFVVYNTALERQSKTAYAALSLTTEIDGALF